MLILVKISKLLFEPIAITAALGGVILLWQLWQAHRHYVFAVTLYGLCFMLGGEAYAVPDPVVTVPL